MQREEKPFPSTSSHMNRGGSLVLRLRDNGLLLALVGLYGMTVLLKLADELVQDGWLALVAGREVAHQGIPVVDHLTFWTSGHNWVDQQWLGQLLFYGIESVGGVRLLLLVHAAFAIGALGLAVVAARRLGGSVRAVSWTAVACMTLILTSAAMRTQSFTYVLFLLVLWLLLRDRGAPSRAVWLTLPILVVWANLHGSVVLGAALVALRSVSLAFDRLRIRGGLNRSSGLRIGLLVVAPVLCLFASPYGFSLFGYYRLMLHNPGFHRLVTEWQPTTPSLEHAPVYLVAFATVWLIGRERSLLTGFEKLALILTMAAAFLAIRNQVWFGLTVLTILPRPLGSVLGKGRAQPKPRLDATVALFGTAALLIGLAVALRSNLERSFPASGAEAVATAAARDPSARVFSSVHYTDWLLWKEPQLRGRVAYDARLELLSQAQLEKALNWRNELGVNWKEAAQGDRIIVLDLAPELATESALLKERGVRETFRDKELAVLVRARR